MTTLRRQPVSHNPYRASFEHLVTELGTALASAFPQEVAFGEVEAMMLRATNEAVRRSLQSRLQRIADSFGDLVALGSRSYKRHQPGRARYFSLCGAMEVDRWTYRPADQRNGKTIVVLDKAAGIAASATPALAFALAQGVAKAPIRSVAADLCAAYREPPSRTKIDRIGRYLGGLVNDAIEDIEPEVRAEETIPAGAKAINLGLDRTTIPMEESSDDEGTNVQSRITVRYRMGYVATSCVTNENGEALATRRYAAPAHEGPKRILERVKADLLRALRQNPALNIGVVQDGAPEMWNLMRDMLDDIPGIGRRRRMGRPVHWRETIDRYHLMEKLGRVLEILVPGDQERRGHIWAKWDAALDRRDGAINDIHRWIDDEKFKASATARREVDKLLGNYLLVHHQFRYASLRGLGLQQGSGVTEGACKSLIAMRAKRSGQRWSPVGISAVLAIRTLLDSDRLEAFWPRFARRFVASDLAMAA